MNKLRQVAAVSALFGAFTLTSSEAVHSPADQRIAYDAVADTFTQDQRTAFEGAQQQVIARWGSLAATKFVLLEGSETFTCNPPADAADYKPITVNSRSPEGPFYCEGSDAVVIEAGWVNGLTSAIAGPYAGRALALEELIVYHEYGHDRQAKAGQLTPPPANATFDQRVAAIQPIELQADCYAGQEMAAIDPVMLERTEEVLGMFPTETIDPTHGGSANRVAYFEAGAAGAPC